MVGFYKERPTLSCWDMQFELREGWIIACNSEEGKKLPMSLLWGDYFHGESFPARSMPIHKFLMSLRYCMLRLETERVSVQGKKRNLLLKLINFRFLAVENCKRQSFLGSNIVCVTFPSVNLWKYWVHVLKEANAGWNLVYLTSFGRE